MKLQVKVTFVVLFLGFLWIFGLFASKDVFATNQSTFTITFQNNGDAQSWVDYNIFEDTSGPFGEYNSGDLVLYYTGSSPDIGFYPGVSVPANSSVTVTRGPKIDYLPTGAVYVSYLPWKNENSDPRDVGCEDPVASLTAKDTIVLGADDIHATLGASRSYACWIPVSAPATNTLNVRSSGLASVPITGTNNVGDNTNYGGTTNYVVTKSNGDIDTTLTAPSPVGQYSLTGWTGCDSTLSGGRCKIRYGGGLTKTVTASYGPLTNTLIVQTTPIKRVEIAATQSITAGRTMSGATAPFYYQVNTTGQIDTTLTAPPEWYGYQFTGWSGCVETSTVYALALSGGRCRLRYEDGQTVTVTANYVFNPPDLQVSVSLPDFPTNEIPLGIATINVRLRVWNSGETAAGGFNTIYRIGSIANDCTDKPQQGAAWRKGSLSPGESASTIFSFPAQPTAGTYTINAMVDELCEINEGAAEANNFDDLTYTIVAPPTNPAGLAISSNICSSAFEPQITFSWNDSLNETGYWLDVTTDSSWTAWSYKVLPANTTLFSWSTVSLMDSGSDLVPQSGTTYWWRVKAFNAAGESSHVYPVSSLSPPGVSFTVPDCTPPANLETSFSCVAGLPSVTFSWTDVSYETGYAIAVNDEAWTGQGSPSGYGYNTNIAANTTSFVWSQDSLFSGGIPKPANNTTYWWQLLAKRAVADGGSVRVYAPDSGVPPGVSFEPPSCNQFDLSASFVGGTMKNSSGQATQSFQAGETVTVDLAIKNTAAANGTSPQTEVGVWPNQTGESNLPDCSVGTPAVPPGGVSFSSGNNTPYGVVNSLNPDTVHPTITVTFTVSDIPGTYRIHAYVIPSCATTSGPDYLWDNNSTAYPENTYITYSVSVDSWFETTGGDVGSGGAISMSLSPAPRPQSGYLLAGASLDPSVISQRWRINNYTKPLVAADPYTYMAERFRQDADTGSKICQVSAGWAAGYNYCDEAEAAFNSGNGPNGNSVFYIDGNFTIKNNLTLNSQYAAIFIVNGNITVETNVTRIDGIYIAGGTFSSTDAAGGVSGNQLVINGAVYGANVNLTRKLSAGATCAYDPSTPATCKNIDDPAEVIIFDPKYLIALNSLLGSPGVSWKEVAP